MPSANFDALVAEARTRYAPELFALAALGYDAQIRVVGHVNISLPGGEVRGVPVELLVCNGDGLVLDEDNAADSTDWCAAVYSRLDGSPLDIFCYGNTAVAAVQAATALLDDPVRIAARSLTGSWHFAMLPAAALGDPNREATLLAPLTSDGLIPTNVIVLEDTPAWTQGCSTHSDCHPVERDAAAFTHRDCAHDRLTHWSKYGLVDDWWASWTGGGPV
ncbi:MULTISPECIES: hypothetical protein [Nocardia]|uniref:Uncharacterized protein n=1 Tax=Nocardia ignorata TaxID=145285 RepID=A0A4R6PJD6_NOCIG|nr:MULTISPECIES: hypothetical protein [Nocardia]MBC7300910.1 hypothetical protein [Nocardia sp.]TDP38524.1 hypothetical protein DFR75_103181 [Nocardia ignorata]